MHRLKKHIIFKIITILFLSVLFTPTAIKLAHVFEHHKHETCHGGTTTHIHNITIDCDFHKFKFSSPFLFTFVYHELILNSSFYKTPLLTYNYHNNHRQLSFSLRGPPYLV